MTIAEQIQRKRLIADGAFGTYYISLYGDGSPAEAGLTAANMPEMANIEAPDRVIRIHREYIEAGADMIRTNTFASNMQALAADAQAVEYNICAAAACARAAVRKAGCICAEETDGQAGENARRIYIAGDIGPIPVEGAPDGERLTGEYIRIGETFLGQGVKTLLFETFPEMETIRPAIQYLKEKYDCEILVHFSVNQYGYSYTGLSAKRLLSEAEQCPWVDGTGLNCGVGPGHMEGLIRSLSLPQKKWTAVFPNSGYPKYRHNRLAFTDNVEYFTEKMTEITQADVRIFGGCCGTTPRYIRALSETVSRTPAEHAGQTAPQDERITGKEICGFMEKRRADPTHKLIAVELAPPVNANDEKLLDAAHILQASGVDVVTFPDSPSGRTRADSVLMAEKVRIETGLCVMPHICCRDKNAIAIRSTILGAKLNHIENFLLLTGDPVPVLFRQTTKSVFNFDSVGMMKIMQEMNAEEFRERPVTYGGAVNHNRMNTKAETERIRRKMAAGAAFFMTQPVFSAEQAETVREMKRETGAVILVGIMPLVSRRNAVFMKNEMTGIVIPDNVTARYGEDMSRAEGERVGVELAREMMALTDDFADGYYFSFPFNRVHMLGEILRKH